MKKDSKKATSKEKAIQASFWGGKQTGTPSKGISEYKQITRNMPFTLRIAK